MSAAVNTKVSLDQLVIKALYYRYKLFIVPVSTIFVCAILFFFLVIPQIQSFFAMRDEIAGDSQKLSTLKQNLQIISKLDDAQLDTYVTVASNALPTDKDFAGVLQAISSAAAKAGTILGDYSFPIGDLVGVNGKAQQAQLPMQLSITLRGDMITGKVFIEELKNQLPLSDTSAISVNSNGTLSLTVTFYYAPLPKIAFDDSVPLVTLAKKDEEVLKLLNLTNASDTTIQQASSSAKTQ